MENKPQQTPKAKDKTAAVVLVALSGPVAWAYTYKRDKLKFWICMAWYVLVIIAIIVVLSELYAEFDMGVVEGVDLQSVDTKANWLYVSLPINVAIWVWAVIDTVRKPDAWYQQYPNYSK